MAGVLLYINELALSLNDIGPLQREVAGGHTDVYPQPGSQDDYMLRTWRPERVFLRSVLPFVGLA